MPDLQIEIAVHPKFLRLLDEKHTFADISGGRGGMKTECVNRLALQDAMLRPLRTCCARETMASMKDSSHKTLTDIIYAHNMAESQNGPFRIMEDRIIRKEGERVVSEFIFVGIRENVRDQKSLKGINRTIVEEAAKLSQDSLDVFVPTVIREPGSQIWFIWNPEFIDDPLYQYLHVHTPSNTIRIWTSYQENPWLSDEMRMLADDCLRDFPEKYKHIWMGEPISSVEGAIYADEIAKAERDGRIMRVPYDAARPVDTFWDLGYGDMVSIWFAQAIGFEYRVIDYEQNSRRALDYYLGRLQSRGYVYGTAVLPWDGGSKSLGSGRSIEELMRAKGFRVRVLPQWRVNDGINAVRTIFPQCYFDADKCKEGLKGLRRYQWGPVGPLGVSRREPLHDDASHPADAFRSLAVYIKAPLKEKQEERKVRIPVYTKTEYSPFA